MNHASKPAMHTFKNFILNTLPVLSAIFGCTLNPIAHAQKRATDRVILDDISVQSLGIEVVEVDYEDFAETLFVIGRIEPIPARKSVLSSRIPGRVVKINAFEGDIVKANTPIVDIESLQPGNPPPTISLDSPMPGMIMKSHTHVGTPVVPDNELFEIMDLTEVYAVARIPEDQAGKLALGARAQIRVAAIPDQTFEGELVRFGTEANLVNGTLDAFFVLENSDYRVRPNMRAEFSVVLETRSNTMSVPRAAIQSDGINRIVFVKDFDLPNAFVKAPIQTGFQNEARAEVLSGLFPGDEVVTRGSYALMFAGEGGVSLKEALDAAHGHEHNEDGSEITADQKRSETPDDARGQGSASQRLLVIFLSILCVLLALLLLLSSMRRGSPSKTESN